MKLNVLTLDKDQKTKISKYIEDKQTTRNVNIFYQVAKVYKLTNLAEVSFSFVERCFPIVVESKNFLELEFNIVAKILASSELSIHSELEVFNAANAWLCHNLDNRSKFAKDILLKVRLPLLSNDVLKYISSNPSYFLENSECVEILKAVSYDKENFFQNKSSNYYVNRYYKQNSNNTILICGGYGLVENEYRTVSKVIQIDGRNLINVKGHPSMIEKRRWCKAVCLKGEVYVFGGCGDKLKSIMSVEKYSPSTNTWNKVADMYDDRGCFCACAFMDKIFIIGGYYGNGDFNKTNSCLQFDTKDNNWKEVTGMNEARDFADCTVFEGRIVVSGGVDNNYNELNTVELYDVIVDKWSSKSNMINSQSEHSLVVVRNKLFVIGYGSEFTCEVFDNKSKKFVALKPPPVEYDDLNKAIAIGSKIFAFQNKTTAVLCYDVEHDKWSEESCEVTNHLSRFSCVKFPRY